MKRKVLPVLLVLGLLVALVVPAANADLPADMSWVKYAGNPVVPSGLCGLSQTARPAVMVIIEHYMVFTEHPGDSGAEIYMARSADDGLSWTCMNGPVGGPWNPVLTVGDTGDWDEDRVIAPSIIYEGGVDFSMWYSGRDTLGNYGIGYATSGSGQGGGLAWTKHADPVLVPGGIGEWDSAIVREPSVVKVDGTYHMWYSGTSQWPYFEIGHATSPDAINWTKDASNPVLSPTAGSWDENEVYGPSVVMNGAVYEMFYSGNAGGAWLTGHASSTDGTTWTKDDNAIISPTGSGWDAGDSTDYVAGVLDGSTWKVFYSGAGSGGYQIGLATLADEAQLTFDSLAAAVGVGNTVDIYIDLTAVTDLYGFQFEVNYDDTKVSATAQAVQGFWDFATNSAGPASWNFVCGAGVCKVAMHKVNPGVAVSGSGTLGKITFTGLAPGLVPLTFSSDILADRDGTALTHSTTTGWLNVYGTATISGVVDLQGRTTPIDAGTVTLYPGSGYVTPTTVPFSAVDGSWSAIVPVGASGKYNIDAAHSLYLGNQATGIAVSVGGTYPQPATTLKGGDANNSGEIEIGDLTCIGGDFGGPPGTCGGTGSSDINADATVDILDLVLAGGNYDLTTPQAW